jgi:hypothetical protein
VDDDVELMIENAKSFNGPGVVSDAAAVVGKWWKSHRAKMD